MESYYFENLKVMPSGCNINAELKISAIVDLFMDMSMNHAEEIGVGISGFGAQNLFWVATKTHIRINRRPRMAQNIKVATWPEKPGLVKCNRDYELICDQETCVVGKTEWVIVDIDTKKPKKTDNTYPQGLDFLQRVAIEEPFERIKDDFDGEVIGSYKVRSIDIDYGRHMNNVAYVRALEGLFSSEEIDMMNISDFEIHYKKSCFEGDMITFVMKREGEKRLIKGILDDASVAVVAVIG